MASIVFDRYKELLLGAQINHTSATLMVGLTISMNATSTDSYWSDIISGSYAAQVTGTGYTDGGKLLVSRTVTQAAGEGQFDAADLTWSSALVTAAQAVLYEWNSDPTAATLIAAYDFGGWKVANNGDFTIQWGSEGLINTT